MIVKQKRINKSDITNCLDSILRLSPIDLIEIQTIERKSADES